MYSASYRNDEILVKNENQALYNAFYIHFNNAYNNGSVL